MKTRGSFTRVWCFGLAAMMASLVLCAARAGADPWPSYYSQTYTVSYVHVVPTFDSANNVWTFRVGVEAGATDPLYGPFNPVSGGVKAVVVYQLDVTTALEPDYYAGFPNPPYAVRPGWGINGGWETHPASGGYPGWGAVGWKGGGYSTYVHPGESDTTYFWAHWTGATPTAADFVYLVHVAPDSLNPAVPTFWARAIAVPLAAEAGPDKTIAAGGSAALAGSASGGMVPCSFSWSPATGLSNPNIAQPTASPATTTTYTLTVTDNLGQTSSDTATVSVSSTLVAEAGPDKTIPVGASAQLEGSAFGGAPPYTYSWSPTTGLSDPGAAQPTASPPTTTTYTLTVTDSLAQTATDTVTVSVVSLIFDDIPPDYWARVWIEAIYLAGITGGCVADDPVTPENEALFCPAAYVTRGQMAVFLVRGLGETECGIYNGYFIDVPESHPWWPWIERIYELGITGGCAGATPGVDLQYCVSGNVTRGQMAIFLIRGMGETECSTYNGYFIDVPESHPWWPWIERIYELGITAGCGGATPGVDLQYCLTTDIPRDQMAVFLARAFLGLP